MVLEEDGRVGDALTGRYYHT